MILRTLVYWSAGVRGGSAPFGLRDWFRCDAQAVGKWGLSDYARFVFAIASSVATKHC